MPIIDNDKKAFFQSFEAGSDSTSMVNTKGNGYLFESLVNPMATYQIMQAYDAYRKAWKDKVSYWNFGTAGEIYDDLVDSEDTAPEENAAEPVDVFVTIADDGEIVTDKNGGYIV